MLCLSTGVQLNCPLWGSIQQQTEKEAGTHSQTLDGGQWQLWRSWGKDWRPRSRWEPHRKTNRVSWPGSPGALRDRATYPWVYSGWTKPPGTNAAQSPWLPCLVTAWEKLNPADLMCRVGGYKGDPTLSEEMCRGWEEELCEGWSVWGRGGDDCIWDVNKQINCYKFKIMFMR